MSLADTAWVFGVFAVSAIVAAVAGFAFGLLSVPLVALRVDAHRAVVLAALVGFGVTLYQAYNWRRFARWDLVWRITISALVGMPLGLWIFSTVSTHDLRIALGVAILVAVALLIRGVDLRDAGRHVDVVAGFLSGVLNTSLSTNGPPLVVGLQARRLAPDAFRGTLAMIFTFSNVASLLMFWARGHIEGGDLVTTALSLPATFVGLWVGGRLRGHVPAGGFRVLVLVLLVITGVVSVLAA